MMVNFATRFASVVAPVLVLLDSLDGSVAAQSTNGTYTVHTTFVYARTGERTPTLLGGNNSVQLTAYGATQMYTLGQFFRNRYIGTGSQAPQKIIGLSPFLVDDVQINVLSPATDFSTKSAQAFMQGFYPGYVLRNASSAGGFDPLSVMANNAYVDWPNGGYQYPMIQTFSAWSPESVWINGQASCTSSDIARQRYYNSSVYASTARATQTLYSAVAPLFAGTDTMPDQWSFGSGWGVWELLDYMNRHNSTVFNAFKEGGAYAGMLPAFAQLADMKIWDLYGDQSASGRNKGDAILTMGGQTLAAKILAHLQSNVYNLGIVNKFNLVTGEYQSMLSLLSLLGLGDFSSRFKTIPPFGSSITFEVFSWKPDSDPSTIPNPSDLWVRFLFRNGSNPISSNPTEVMPDMQAYPIFRRGPNSIDMPWKDFQQAMTNISTNSVLGWCQTCQADTIFCAPFLNANGGTTGSGNGSGRASKLSPAVSGVIGAIVTLAIAGLLAALAMHFGGLRFYRREPAKKSLGGFKGSAKMASDADLSLPKHSAPVGLSFGTSDHETSARSGGRGDEEERGAAPPHKTHERVGSWELKAADKEGGHARFASLGSTVVSSTGRPSLDEDEDAYEHGADGVLSAPVSPRESI